MHFNHIFTSVGTTFFSIVIATGVPASPTFALNYYMDCQVIL